MTTLREIFDRRDSDGSGTIEVDELEAILGELGLDAGDDATLVAMAKLQTAAPGRLTFDELSAWWAEVSPTLKGEPADDPQLQGLFDRFDRDGSGTIDVAELEALLGAAGQPVDKEAVYAAIQSVDADASGTLSWGEFKAWWAALHSR